MALETKSSASLLPSRSESMPVLESTEDKTVAGLDETKDLNELPPTVTFVSSDNQEFELDRKDVQISILVKTSLEADPHATTIPILQVDGKTLAKIVEYCTHHQGTEPPLIEKPLRSKIMLDVVRDPWDANFIDSIGHNRQALYDLTLAANYMDIKSLLHLGCAKVASLIKGQPLDKIKEILDPNQNLAGASPLATESKESKAS